MKLKHNYVILQVDELEIALREGEYIQYNEGYKKITVLRIIRKTGVK